VALSKPYKRGVADGLKIASSTIFTALHHKRQTLQLTLIRLETPQDFTIHTLEHHERQNSDPEAIHRPEAWDVSIA